MPAHFLIIANPTAGAAAGRASRTRLLEAAQHELEKNGAKVEVVLASDAVSVSEAAFQAAQSGCECVVAAGGDGTVNAVVNGLMRAASGKPPRLESTVLGVLPLGTGNVFAFNLGIRKTWREACKVLRAGNVRVIDVGLARSGKALSTKQKTVDTDESLNQSDTRYFVLMAGIGFDAKVIEETSLRLKFVLRDFAYALKSLQNAVVHRGTQMKLKFSDGRVFADQSWLVIVGNAASYAWDIKVTGHARLDDGLLDVCLLPYENKLFSVQQAMMMLIGQHVERGTAHYWKTRSVRIDAKPAVPIQLDGDEWAQTPVEISILPGALKVLAPPE